MTRSTLMAKSALCIREQQRSRSRFHFAVARQRNGVQWGQEFRFHKPVSIRCREGRTAEPATADGSLQRLGVSIRCREGRTAEPRRCRPAPAPEAFLFAVARGVQRNQTGQGRELPVDDVSIRCREGCTAELALTSRCSRRTARGFYSLSRGAYSGTATGSATEPPRTFLFAVARGVQRNGGGQHGDCVARSFLFAVARGVQRNGDARLRRLQRRSFYSLSRGAYSGTPVQTSTGTGGSVSIRCREGRTAERGSVTLGSARS